MKKITKIAKFVLVFGVIIISATLVRATLITYFTKSETTLTITQAVNVDGHDWSDPITETLSAAGGDVTYSETTHIITNLGEHDVNLMWSYSGDPDLIGITVVAVDPVSHLPISLTPLVAGGSVQFIFEYTVDEMIQSGTYIVEALLVPEI